MKKLLLLVFLTSLAVSASAQQYAGTNQITLDQAIKIALDKNYTTTNASLQLQEAEYTRSKAGDNILPSADASGSYGYNKGLTATSIAGGPAVVPDGSHSLTYNVGASFNIYNGGFDAANIRSSEYRLDAARYNLKWVRQTVAYNVTSAYIAALRYKALLVSAQTTFAEDSALLNRIQAQYEVGSLARTAVYQQQAVLGQDELSRIQAANNYDNALGDLLYLLNMPPNTSGNYDVSLSGIDTTIGALRQRSSSLDISPSGYDELLTRREDLAAQRSNILSQEEGITITRAALLPSLNTNIGIGGSGSSTDLGSIPLYHGLNAGLTLRVPLFDKMQTRLQIDIEKVQLEESRVLLTQAEQDFRNQIAAAENNLRSSSQAVAASDRALAAAEESLRAATEKLAVGAGIQVDVIVAEGLATTARVNRINTVYNFLLAQKNLEYLLGKTNY